MTGPSLTSSTRMSVRNRPVSTVGAEGTERLDDPIDERLGVLGARGGDPARAPALRGVAVERELAHDEQRTADVGDGTVHHAVGVVEDPQSPELVGEAVGVGERCRCA